MPKITFVHDNVPGTTWTNPQECFSDTHKLGEKAISIKWSPRGFWNASGEYVSRGIDQLIAWAMLNITHILKKEGFWESGDTYFIRVYHRSTHDPEASGFIKDVIETWFPNDNIRLVCQAVEEFSIREVEVVMYVTAFH